MDSKSCPVYFLQGRPAAPEIEAKMSLFYISRLARSYHYAMLIIEGEDGGF
jgi:hypothetical protein